MSGRPGGHPLSGAFGSARSGAPCRTSSSSSSRADRAAKENAADRALQSACGGACCCALSTLRKRIRILIGMARPFHCAAHSCSAWRYRRSRDLRSGAPRQRDQNRDGRKFSHR